MDKKTLVIGCPRLFLHKCIIPGLRDFYTQHPDVDIKFVVGESSPVIDPDMDAQIVIGDFVRKSFVYENIVACDLCLVCNPDYLQTNPKPTQVGDLKQHTLLRSTEFTKDWETWLGESKDTIFSKSRFIDFDNAGLELSAAMEGLGIAIVRLNLVKKEISQGRLVELMPEQTITDHYSLLYQETKLQSSNFMAFRRWLKITLTDSDLNIINLWKNRML